MSSDPGSAGGHLPEHSQQARLVLGRHRRLCQKARQTVEQTGTDSDCDQEEQEAQDRRTHLLRVVGDVSGSIRGKSRTRSSPGDSMTPQVSASGTSFTLTLTGRREVEFHHNPVVHRRPPVIGGMDSPRSPSGCNGC